MSPSASDKSTIDRILDAGVFAPIGFLVTGDARCGNLAQVGRKQVSFARSLGRAALKGVSQGMRPGETTSVAAPTPSPTAAVRSMRQAPPEVAVEGYKDMTARDIIALVRASAPEQAQWIKSQETAGKQRVTVLRAVDTRLDEDG